MVRTKGFTLIELMITIAVIAILSAIALPAYTDYITRGKIAEATVTLADMRIKLEQWYQDNRNYGSTASACGVALPTTPAVRYFTVTCNWGAGGTNQSFTVTATGGISGGDQSMAGFSYTINETNAKTSTITGDPASRGWQSNGACWVTKKGGLC